MKYAPYSMSKINTYKGDYGCPYKFFMNYVQGIEEPMNHAALVGIATHEFIERYSQLCLNNLEPSQDDETALWDDISNNKLFNDDIMKEAWEIWENYRVKFDRPTPKDANDLQLEVELAINDNEEYTGFYDENCFFRGKADRIKYINNDILITDYKTGRTEQDATQLCIYAWNIGLSLGIMDKIKSGEVKITGEYIYVRFPKTRRFEISYDDIMNARTNIYRDVYKIESDSEYKCRRGGHCEWCHFMVNGCPAYQNVDKIHDDLQIKEIAQQTQNLKRIIRKNEEIIKSYVTINGNIDIEEGSYQLSDNTSISITDKEKMYSILVERGLNPVDIFKINTDYIKQGGLMDDQEINSLLKISKRSSLSFSTKSKNNKDSEENETINKKEVKSA